MKTVFVKLFAELNLGDDLFLHILLKRYPKTQFVLTARKEYSSVFSDYPNLRVEDDTFVELTRKKRFKILSNAQRAFAPALYQKNLQKAINRHFSKAFKESDVFVSIGGSVFMQPKKLPFYTDVEYYKIVNKHFKDIFYIGCNFGPFNDLKYKESYSSVFAKAKEVSFREEYSYKLFSELNNVEWRPDVVFGLDFRPSVKENRSVGFSIIKPRGGVEPTQYISKYIELITFYQDQGYKVFVFSFCKKQGDEEIINHILNGVPNRQNITEIFYNGDIDGFLKTYSSVEKMYCGRFHAMILSMIFGQHIFPISYSDKMTNVLDDIKYEGKFIRMEDFAHQNVEDLDRQISKNSFQVDEQILKSREHFFKLDSVLNK